MILNSSLNSNSALHPMLESAVSTRGEFASEFGTLIWNSSRILLRLFPSEIDSRRCLGFSLLLTLSLFSASPNAPSPPATLTLFMIWSRSPL